MRAEDYQRRRQELAGWPVGIVSYKLGDRFICEIDNVAPERVWHGPRAPRARRPSATAMETAERRLGRTKVHPVE